MNQARGPNAERVVNTVLVIAPPLTASPELNEHTIRASVVEAAERHFGRTLTEREQAAIDHQLKTTHSDDLRIASAVKAMAGATPQSAVLILKAAGYRDEEVRASSHKKPELPEDLWVPHLVKLARAVTEFADTIPCYVLIDTGEAAPSTVENLEALKSVSKCGVFMLGSEDEAPALVASHLQEWREQMNASNIGAAFRSVDGLPASMDDQKPFLKLQLLDRVAPSQEVLNFLRSQIDMNVVCDPKARLKLAGIAQRAEDLNLAKEILAPVIASLADQEDLEIALKIAVRVSDPAIIRVTRSRLEKLFPQSVELWKHRLTELLDAGNYQEMLVLLEAKESPEEAQLALFFRTLATALQSRNKPDYNNTLRVIEQTVPELADWARILCARDALARDDCMTAIRICLPTEGRVVTPTTARMLLWAVRQMLLQRDSNGSLTITADQICEPVAEVIRYLVIQEME